MTKKKNKKQKQKAKKFKEFTKEGKKDFLLKLKQKHILFKVKKEDIERIKKETSELRKENKEYEKVLKLIIEKTETDNIKDILLGKIKKDKEILKDFDCSLNEMLDWDKKIKDTKGLEKEYLEELRQNSIEDFINEIYCNLVDDLIETQLKYVGNGLFSLEPIIQIYKDNLKSKFKEIDTKK